MNVTIQSTHRERSEGVIHDLVGDLACDIGGGYEMLRDVADNDFEVPVENLDALRRAVAPRQVRVWDE